MPIMLGAWCSGMAFGLRNKGPGVRAGVYRKDYSELVYFATVVTERDLTQSYDKNPFTNRKFKNQVTTQKRHQKLRLHNDCGPTGVVKPVYDHSTFPSTAKAV